MHKVTALAGRFRHLVANMVDDISVVAPAARHLIGAEAAVEHIGGGVAGKHVGAGIAGAVDRIEAGQRQIVDPGPKVKLTELSTRSTPWVEAQLDRLVAGIVDDIGVVAGAAASSGRRRRRR